MISVREKISYKNILKYTDANKVFLTGDLIFSYFIINEIKNNLKKTNVNHKKIFYDSSKQVLRDTLINDINLKEYQYLIPLISPNIKVLILNPLRSFKYYFLTIISFFIPKNIITKHSRIFNHKYQTFNIKKGLELLFNSEYVVTGRFHIVCILIIIKKSFSTYK